MAPMPLEPPIPVDTRAFFRPVSTGLVDLLRGLSGEDWERPTVARQWVVRDVVAHLLDTTLRRLSFHRDGMKPPPPAETDRVGTRLGRLHQRAQRAMDHCLEAIESACLDRPVRAGVVSESGGREAYRRTYCALRGYLTDLAPELIERGFEPLENKSF